jgi:hypothetical protein
MLSAMSHSVSPPFADAPAFAGGVLLFAMLSPLAVLGGQFPRRIYVSLLAAFDAPAQQYDDVLPVFGIAHPVPRPVFDFHFPYPAQKAAVAAVPFLQPLDPHVDKSQGAALAQAGDPIAVLRRLQYPLRVDSVIYKSHLVKGRYAGYHAKRMNEYQEGQEQRFAPKHS